jgi:hypothetical protein
VVETGPPVRKAERAALINAGAKLGAFGRTRYPHTSAVRDADRLRELRRRAGRSGWRALYRQVGEVFVVRRSSRRPNRTRVGSGG